MRRTEAIVHDTHRIETQVTGTESRPPNVVFVTFRRTQLISLHRSSVEVSPNWCVRYMMHSSILGVGVVRHADGTLLWLVLLTAANTDE